MKIKANNSYIGRLVAGEYILVPVGSENKSAVIMLNETGQFIWENIQNEISVDELIGKAKETFADPNCELESQLREFITELMNQKFVLCEG